MAAAETTSLTGAFTWVAGVVITEILLFSLVHSNPGGMAAMAAISPMINEIYQAIGITELGFAAAEALGHGAAEMATSAATSVVTATMNEVAAPILLPP